MNILKAVIGLILIIISIGIFYNVAMIQPDNLIQQIYLHLQIISGLVSLIGGCLVIK